MNLNVQCSNPTPVLKTMKGPETSVPTSTTHELYRMDTHWDREG